MEWDDGAYQVEWKGQTIGLLPKEYALLRYLHEHAGQTLSREQLLDGVWPMEAPVDRTVDDHIYRLRRKLAGWEALLRIETIRGLGYRLLLKKEQTEVNPLQGLSAFKADMQGIADTYLRYGRGDALLTLARHQAVLGFEVDATYRLLLRVMEGDVRFIVDKSQGTLAERAYLLLFCYQFLDPKANRKYVEQVLRDHLMPEPWHTEMGTMSIVSALMDWGEYAKAEEKLTELAGRVVANNWEGLIPYTANLQLEYILRTKQWSKAAAAITDVEGKLARYPYLREEGQFHILRGLWLYRSDREAGLALVRDGLKRLTQSQFLANLLHGYHTLLMMADEEEWGADRQLMEREWERLTARCGLIDIRAQIEAELNRL